MLKYDFYRFLSNVDFSDVEIRDIFKAFLNHYENYNEDQLFYSRAYRLMKILVKENLISTSKKKRNILYSSNYSPDQILQLIPNETESVYTSISQDESRCKEDIANLQLKISLFSDYLTRYPILSELIQPKLDVLIKEKESLELNKKVANEILMLLTNK